jgi:hypothetical protein
MSIHPLSELHKSATSFAGRSRPTSFSLAEVLFASLALSGVAIAGCTAQIEPAHSVVVVDDEVEVIQTAPVMSIETYPQTTYRGQVVYLVDGRWYYPRSNHWYAYRREPAELVRHRASLRTAPPARVVAPAQVVVPAQAAPPARREQHKRDDHRGKGHDDHDDDRRGDHDRH